MLNRVDNFIVAIYVSQIECSGCLLLFFRLRDAVGDNGKTALQPWCEIVPMVCRAVVSRHPQFIVHIIYLFSPNCFVLGFIQYLCGKIERQYMQMKNKEEIS
ncbi:MAG: hypothetical protein J5588_00110 [Bacteroidales bacterium]|nr:hypothetical protein [Bacteroidales bacterium]